MKKWLIVLCSTFVLAGCVTNENESLSFEIDPVATANAPWEVGGETMNELPCYGDNSPEEKGCYTLFMGITLDGYVLIQDYYASGVKHTDPYTVISLEAAQSIIGKRLIGPTGARSSVEGPWRSYFRNGEPEAKINFKNGQRQGLITEWYENGQKRKEERKIGGQLHGTQTNWNNNGQKHSETHYSDGLLHGVSTLWYDNGHKRYQYEYKDGKLHGTITRWYENGQKAEEGERQDGKDEGLWTSWYDNGQEKNKGYYKASENIGKWRFWDEQGNLIKEIDYSTPK